MTERPRRRRVRVSAILLALAAVLGACLWHSNRALQVVEARFASARLPAPFDGFTIVQLTDLHGAVFGEDNSPLLERVAAAEPDLIAVTGDILDRFRETPVSYAVGLCERLSAIAPTYFVTGNHDWALGTDTLKELLSALEGVGVDCLGNEAVRLEREGASIVLAGIHDPNGWADQKTPAETAAEVYARYGDPFWILLAHRNDRFEGEYAPLGADLTLSGHGHGGIVRLPFTDGLLGTDRRLFPSYTAGFYEAGGATVYVSRGLGNSGPSLRLFNRPEITVLRLERQP